METKATPKATPPPTPITPITKPAVATAVRGTPNFKEEMAPKRSEGFVPDYMLRNILRHTGALKRGAGNDIDRARNEAIVTHARDTLGAGRRLWKNVSTEQGGHPGDLRETDRPLDRETFDADFKEKMPPKPELTETDLVTRVESATRAHDALKTFYQLNQKIGFNSMDIVPKKDPMQAVVRWGHMDNAYYDGHRMVLGAGNPDGLFKDLTLAHDVTYHEVGHGMTEHVLTKGNEAARASVDYRVAQGLITPSQGRAVLKEALAAQAYRKLRSDSTIEPMNGLLEYRGQSGALNESLSDIYGIMGLHYEGKVKLGSLGEKDWLIGHNALNDDVKADPGHTVALRNMLHPGTAYNDPRLGKDPQPADVGHLYRGKADNGGVHINSGIGNRAFAEASTKLGETMPDATTWDTTGKVWLHAMSLVGPNATFQEAADAIVQTAKQFFPNNPKVAEAISYGWQQVGVTAHDSPAAPSAGLK